MKTILVEKGVGINSMSKDSTLRRFGVSMEDSLLDQFDTYIAQKGYSTRSEALSDLVRDALSEETLTDETTEVVATISLVYNHHVRNLNAKLTQFQHEALDIITSTLHVHLDEQSCLEVLIVRGPQKRVRQLAEHLISIKGVKHGKFVATVAQTEPGKHPEHSHAHSHSI